jgi:hypothetical protein
MTASDALGGQFVTMRPSELMPYARDRSDKMAQAKIRVLADSIGTHGYRASKMRGNKAPITLDSSGRRPELTEGNHRVHAMNRIGYNRPVKVRVK